jgi:RNA polymerase sigma factor (sigma-70 family)
MSQNALIAHFLALYPDLRARLRGRLRSQDLADEALNETWLRLRQAAPDTGPIRDIKAYLSRMAINIAVDRKRAGAKLASASDIEALLGVLPTAEPSPEQTVIARLDLERLGRAIDRLTPRRRAILIAIRLDGKTCSQLASELGLSKRTVETELRDALAHCADHLAAAEKNICGGSPPRASSKGKEE